MYLANIVTGTNFDIILEDDTLLKGEYESNSDHLNFHIHCSELLNKIDTYVNSEVEIKFLVKDSLYGFKAEILSRSGYTAWGRETVDLVIKTPIKELPRREDFRMNIKVKVKIHDFVDNKEMFYTGREICEAVSDDLSKNGARIWCDRHLDVPLNTMFTLEFTHPLKSTHLIPAKLVRSQQNTITRTYNYDYGFAFDFTKSADIQEQLVVDCFEAKLRGVV